MIFNSHLPNNHLIQKLNSQGQLLLFRGKTSNYLWRYFPGQKKKSLQKQNKTKNQKNFMPCFKAGATKLQHFNQKTF